MALEISLKNKKILVTGAGNGIGLALCKVLHLQGAQLFALDVSQEALDNLQKSCPGSKTICVNLLNWDETRKAVESISETMDGLVNNAGIGAEANFMSIKPDVFDRVIGVNVKAIVNVSQVVSKKMIESGQGGSIVNVSSLASRFGTRASVPYNISKAGVDMLTKSQALELGEYNIRVNSVNPNIVMTDLARQWMAAGEGAALKEKLISRTPLGRIAEIYEVVNSIIFLLSDAAPMIHGEHLFIDGGFSAS